MTSVIRGRIVAQALWVVFYGRRELTLDELGAKLRGVADLALHVDQLACDGVLEVDRRTRRIYGVSGITLIPTDHLVRLGKSPRFARSLDAALTIMAELGESGYVETRCPDCGRRLSLEISNGEIQRVGCGFHNWRCAYRIDSTKLERAYNL